MSAVRASLPLDPRSAFVLDIHELGRRAGSMRELVRDVAAPSDWGLGLVTVPPGTQVHLDLRLESVMEGVLVSGTASVAVTAECGRCLDPLRTTLRVPLQELYAYEAQPGEDADDQELVHGDFIDLERMLRDAVVLALPTNPVCSEDCEGLCVDCGVKLADLPDDHAHDATDPRWAALSALVNLSADHPEEN